MILIWGICFNQSLKLLNKVQAIRKQKGLSQEMLANMIGVSRNTISSIETGQYESTAKIALLLCLALDMKFEDMFYF